MKEKVYVSVKGLHFVSTDEGNVMETQEEAIEIINVGKYRRVGENEYIKYSEMIEGENKPCSSMIKIGGDGSVELTKKGSVTAHLLFMPGEKTMTFYETPYGNLYLGVFAREVLIDRDDDCIKIIIDYGLEMNYEHVSDCRVEIKISSYGKLEL